MRKALLGAAALVLLVAGCGAPENGGTYATVTELRDAAVKAGMDCPNWEQHNMIEHALTSGWCGDTYVLAVYSSESTRDADVAEWRELENEYDYDYEFQGIIGENWTLTGEDVIQFKDKLGGLEYKGGNRY